MSSADKALLQFESGQTIVPMAALTDSGNRTLFTSPDALWSGVEGKEYNVKPNGIETGGAVAVAVSASNDVVDVAALTCYLAGVQTSVGAGIDTSIGRASTDTHLISSITVNAAGSIAVVAGSEGTSFSETRAAAGGPPLIPVDSIEVAQVRLSGQTPAPITINEIFQLDGLHREKYDSPIVTVDPLLGQIEFASALPAIHTGNTAKGVFASYATPIFAEAVDAYDFNPPEESVSVSSTAVYNRVAGSTSKSLQSGSFSQLMKDGVTDDLISQEGEKLWFRFYPNRNKPAFLLTQGILSISRSYPAAGDMVAACTIAPEAKTERRAS